MPSNNFRSVLLFLFFFFFFFFTNLPRLRITCAIIEYTPTLVVLANSNHFSNLENVHVLIYESVFCCHHATIHLALVLCSIPHLKQGCCPPGAGQMVYECLAFNRRSKGYGYSRKFFSVCSKFYTLVWPSLSYIYYLEPYH